jgi:hypothetical protein
VNKTSIIVRAVESGLLCRINRFKEINNSGDLNVDREIILKCILEKYL